MAYPNCMLYFLMIITGISNYTSACALFHISKQDLTGVLSLHARQRRTCRFRM
jgi:hypothetical protein